MQVFAKKAKPVNMAAKRVVGTEAAKYFDMKKGVPKSEAAKADKVVLPKGKLPKWKAQSEQLRNAMGANKKVRFARARASAAAAEAARREGGLLGRHAGCKTGVSQLLCWHADARDTAPRGARRPADPVLLPRAALLPTADCGCAGKGHQPPRRGLWHDAGGAGRQVRLRGLDACLPHGAPRRAGAPVGGWLGLTTAQPLECNEAPTSLASGRGAPAWPGLWAHFRAPKRE